MAGRFAPDDPVQTPLGKGVILEVRTGGRLLVRVHDRSVLLPEAAVRPGAPQVSAKQTRVKPRHPRGAAVPSGIDASKDPPDTGARRVRTIDLHGCTVEDAIARVDAAVNEALLADVSELRIIHGRSGGRLRAAVQRRLRELPIRAARLDPMNAGVTVVWI